MHARRKGNLLGCNVNVPGEPRVVVMILIGTKKNILDSFRVHFSKNP